MSVTEDFVRGTAASPTNSMSEFVRQQMHALLATSNDDGSIHAVPLVYLYRNGRLIMATSSRTRKARNIAARPEVTVTIDDHENSRWVSAVGSAQLVRGEPSRQLNDRLYRLWMTEEGLDVVGRALHEVEDVTVVVTPHRWLAWDIDSGFFTPLREAGISMNEPERWFLH